VDEKIVLIGALLLCAVLLFGCTGGGGAQGAGAQGGGTAGATATPTAAPTQGGGVGGGGSDWTGKAFAELLALGVPLQCDVQVDVEGGVGSSKMFLSGGRASVESQVRVEATTYSMKTVLKDKKIYSSVLQAMKNPGTPYANCDWIVMDESEAKQSGSGQTDYTKIPATKFSCAPWTPDDSKFTTIGETCTLGEIMGGFSPSVAGGQGGVPTMPAGLEACSGLEGQALMDCVQSNTPQ
jgi:hypothetical protein